MNAFSEHISGPNEPQHPLERLSYARILANNVMRLRKRQRLTKTRFCLMAGISRPTLDKIEKGDADPKLSLIEDVADALGATVIDLLTWPPASGQKYRR